MAEIIPAGVHRPRNVDWKRAAALLYGDWGTSKAYVLGLAFVAAGFASFPIILAVCVVGSDLDANEKSREARKAAAQNRVRSPRKRAESRVGRLSRAFNIRCRDSLPPSPSSELRRAMEMLNRYIDGGRKRDQTTDLRGIDNSGRRIRSRRAWKPRGCQNRRRHACHYRFVADTAATTTPRAHAS
jgi:hypothetical protein